MSTKPVRVLVVGQTPPPFHGQGIMLERLVNASMERVDKRHVRMAFSKNMDEVGRAGVGKVIHLLQVIWNVVTQRFLHRSQVLYYPPAGPNRIPMWRDIVILICTRWLFQKTVFHMQASGISELYPSLGNVGRWFFRRAYFEPDCVIRLSEHTSNDAQSLRAKREFIIPNCADDELANYADIQQQRLARSPESAPKLLYLGTVCRTKGILVLLEACKELLERGRDFQLDVVGSFQPAEFEHEVREAISNAGLNDNVRLCGQLTGSQKFEKLAAADMFCFPSFYESEAFPCVLVEAMSFSLPVVSTHWRGIRSIVDDGETGLLVDIQDSKMFGLAVQQLCDDRGLLQRMGAAGRAKYVSHYTTQRHVGLMEEALVSVGECMTTIAPMNRESADEGLQIRGEVA